MRKIFAIVALLGAFCSSFSQLSVKPVFDWRTGELKHVYSLKVTDGLALHSIDGEPAIVQRIDVTETSTPEVGTVYAFSYTSSGASYLLSSLPVYEVYFNLPFGLDFQAGWGGVYGQKMNGTEFVGNVFGAELYGRKRLGGSGAFLKGSIYGVVGESSKPDFGLALALGWEF